MATYARIDNGLVAATTGISLVVAVDSETHGKNLALLACIKY